MVYPEKSSSSPPSAKKSNSWCEPPLQVVPSSTRTGIQNEERFGTTNFVKYRLHQLVAAFSSRTQLIKDEMSSENQRKRHISLTASEFQDDVEQIDFGAPIEDHPEPEFTRKSLLAKALFAFWIVDPNGTFYTFWMCFLTVSVLYNAWVIPMRSTFPYQTAENQHLWMFFDYFADFLYIFDMVAIQPRTTYLDDGFLVTDGTLLWRNYMRKIRFKMDLFALVPLDLLYLWLGPQMVLLRLGRLLKLHAFWEFFNLVDKLLANPYFIRIARTLLYMMYLIHLNACAYYAFSVWQGLGTNSFVFNGMGSAYIKCFYFATKTATSIGKNPKPTQVTEYLFMTVSWLMGVFVFALLIGQIRDIISTATRAKTRYRNLMNETLEYMRRLNMPKDVQNRVKLWFNYTWQVQRTLDANTIMDCLPQKLKTDVAINIHIETLSKVNLFADCDHALLRELVLQLKSVIYLPGDVICKEGDVGKEMYIIQSGRVQVLRPASDHEVLATLSEGSVFGEISLLGIPGMNRRTADVRSEGYSNLFVLSKADLNAAIAHYPEAQFLLNRKAKQVMRKNAALLTEQTPPVIIIEKLTAADNCRQNDTLPTDRRRSCS